MTSEDYSIPRCERCGQSMDQCRCNCPFCGESEACTCAVGYAVATGG